MSTKFDASVSVTTAKRRNKEEEEEKKLAKTFAGWVNAQLKPVNVKIEDPIEDLKDGVNLILLLEAVSKKSIEQTMNAKYIRKPSTTIQKVENVSLALKFLNDHIGLKQNVNAEDIVNGNRKILLTLLWRLISSGIAAQPVSEEQLKKQKEQEQKEVSATQKMKQAKEKLMMWTREQTAGYKGIELNDFENSFRDGLIFCALVHKYDASFLDYDSLSKDKAVDNLKLAFKIAEEKMNVGSYLEAEDLANPENKIDERSIMTYLSQFPVAFLSHKSSEPSKADNLEKQLEETRQRALQEEQKFKEEKERVDVLHKQKEQEKEQLEQQKQQLKQEIAAAESEEDPELWNSHFKLVDDNRKLREDLERLQAIKDSLQKDLISTKKKLIGELSVTVHEGRNLRSSGILGLDSFVTLSYETQQSRTRTVSRRLNPQYNQTFTFYITDTSSPLEIVVHSWHLLWKPGFRGKLVIPINFLQAGEQLCKFHKLVHEEGKKQKEYGELRLTLAYKEG